MPVPMTQPVMININLQGYQLAWVNCRKIDADHDLRKLQPHSLSSPAAASPADSREAMATASPSQPLASPCPKAALYIVRCVDKLTCAPPEEVPHGRIRAPSVGTREAMLLWPDAPRTVLIIKKWRDPDATAAATGIADWIRDAFGVSVLVYEDSAEEPESRFRSDMARFSGDSDHVDVIVSVGGDGTVLQVSSMFPGAVPPVIAIACGSLGFLTVHSLSNCQIILERVLGRMEGIAVDAASETRVSAPPLSSPKATSARAPRSPRTSGAVAPPLPAATAAPPAAAQRGGPIPVSLRMRLRVDVYRAASASSSGGDGGNDHVASAGATVMATPVATHVVLNELLLERGRSPYMATLAAFVDDEPLTTVAADGLIVATQTGSTAYSLSAGGSILSPDTASIVFTPICPHTLSFRPLLFPDSARLRLEVPRDARASAWCSFDGRHSIELAPGDYVTVESSPWPLPLVCRRTALADWVRALKWRLFWNVREKQRTFARPTLASNAAAAAATDDTAGGGGGSAPSSGLQVQLSPATGPGASAHVPPLPVAHHQGPLATTSPAMAAATTHTHRHFHAGGTVGSTHHEAARSVGVSAAQGTAAGSAVSVPQRLHRGHPAGPPSTEQSTAAQSGSSFNLTALPPLDLARPARRSMSPSPVPTPTPALPQDARDSAACAGDAALSATSHVSAVAAPAAVASHPSPRDADGVAALIRVPALLAPVAGGLCELEAAPMGAAGSLNSAGAGDATPSTPSRLAPSAAGPLPSLRGRWPSDASTDSGGPARRMVAAVAAGESLDGDDDECDGAA